MILSTTAIPSFALLSQLAPVLGASALGGGLQGTAASSSVDKKTFESLKEQVQHEIDGYNKLTLITNFATAMVICAIALTTLGAMGIGDCLILVTMAFLVRSHNVVQLEAYDRNLQIRLKEKDLKKRFEIGGGSRLFGIYRKSMYVIG